MTHHPALLLAFFFFGITRQQCVLCPGGSDLWRFPGPHVCRVQLDAAERELAALHRHQEHMPADDRRVSDLIWEIDERVACWRLLDSAWSASDPSVRRACLSQLRDRLGWPAYQGGCLPTAIPCR